jgi:hypothetical protein
MRFWIRNYPSHLSISQFRSLPFRLQALVGKPKLFFIEACRGQEQNRGMPLMTKVNKIMGTSVWALCLKWLTYRPGVSFFRF